MCMKELMKAFIIQKNEEVHAWEYRFVVISFNEFLTNQIYYLSFIFDTRKSNTANVFSRKMAFHK